jgi:hypothetical protein
LNVLCCVEGGEAAGTMTTSGCHSAWLFFNRFKVSVLVRNLLVQIQQLLGVKIKGQIS